MRVEGVVEEEEEGEEEGGVELDREVASPKPSECMLDRLALIWLVSRRS